MRACTKRLLFQQHGIQLQRHSLWYRSRSLFAASTSHQTNEKSIYVVGTFDTKGEELTFLAKSIANKLCKWSEPSISDTNVKLIDISTSKCITYSESDPNKDNDNKYPVDMTCREIIPNWKDLPDLARNEANHIITESLTKFLQNEYSSNRMNGIISIGGSCATAITSAAFTKDLPLGLPKIIVSTVASSNMAQSYIGFSDLILMPSIVDISGVNNIYKTVIENASSSIVGMAQNYRMNEIETKYMTSNKDKFTIGITMFGITTKCVEFVKQELNEKYGEDNINCLVFHATGTGGKCMEYLISNGYIDGIIDLTTTEVADFICDGVMSCDQTRFLPGKDKNLPTIISLGAVNTVNFGEKSSIPSHLLTSNDNEERIFHIHNEQVTLMKANQNELKDIATFIAEKVNKYNKNNVKLMIPNKGISALDDQGSTSSFAPFIDQDLNTLKTTFESQIIDADKQIISYVDCHINDQLFAKSVVDQFDDILQKMNIDIENGNDNDKRNDIKTKMKSMNKDNFMINNSRRKEIISSFYDKINKNIAIIGAGAGTGISAKCEVDGGADLIIIYNSGRYRMAGRGSLAGILAFGDANQIVQEMANEVIPIVNERNNKVPIIAGINGTDPFKNMDGLLSNIKDLGFDGVQNFPTVGLIDGKFRSNLEETGFSYDKEVEFMDIAKNKYDLITTPYVFDVNEAIKMTEIGVDIIVIHLGLTVGGNIGAKTLGMTLNDSLNKISIISNAVKKINNDQIILCHGGPVATPNDVKYLLDNLPKGTIDGFYGASSMERLPVEISITETLKEFKNLKL